MNALTEDSRTDSLSYPVVTHDRKGREGKGDRKGGDVGHFGIPSYYPGRTLPAARDHAPSRTNAKSGDGWWMR